MGCKTILNQCDKALTNNDIDTGTKIRELVYYSDQS